MENYVHKVQYYETDRMGISHHSNYVRWMEEARVHFLDSHDCGYSQIEELGFSSPVLGIECKYRKTTTFGDEVEIEIRMSEYNSVKMEYEYIMKNKATGEIVCTAKSSHCFINSEGRPISLKKVVPEIDEKLRTFCEGK